MLNLLLEPTQVLISCQDNSIMAVIDFTWEIDKLQYHVEMAHAFTCIQDDRIHYKGALFWLI